MSHLDYFVVGPTIALATEQYVGSTRGPRLDFSVLSPTDSPLGSLRTELLGDHVSVSIVPNGTSQLTAATAIEAVRLAARVVAKLVATELRCTLPSLSGAEAGVLRADGFRQVTADEWYLPPGAGPDRSPQAKSMESLYSDPFSVVWNFEPRPWDALTPLLMAVGQRPSADVLDIGCGYGKNARLLERCGVRTHGVDVAASAIAQCRRWALHPERFVVSSLDALPHPDASVDFVLDVGCLHCMPSELLTAGIAQVARVLKPGGWMFSRVLRPRDRSWLEAQRYRVSQLGLPPDELSQLLDPYFELAITADAEVSLVRARRRG